MRIDSKQVKVRMHRFLLNAPSKALVDHVDGDGLNNTRGNIRIATRSQNAWNRHQSKLKGLRYRPANAKWEARISVHGTTIQIGQFNTDVEAALAYDRKARELHGDFACLNFHPDFEDAYNERRAMQD